MKRFDLVKEILEKAVAGEVIGFHGNFWRGVDLPTFVSMNVAGRKLVQPGNGPESNLVKALRGQAPFGRDVSPRPPGAIFRRMPAGRPPVDAASISFIEDWVNDGCPDDEIAPDIARAAGPRLARTLAAEMADAADIVRFYREFDNFFLFGASSATGNAVSAFMAVVPEWPGWTSANSETGWQTAIAPLSTSSIRYLSTHQLRIMRDHFGTAIDRERLTEAFWRFGKGDLPADPLRPREPKHQMDGATMWLFWLSFADAAIRLNESAGPWELVGRAIPVGLVADALFRTDRDPGDRLTITRYQANQPNLKQKVIGDVAALSGGALLAHNIELAREAVAPAVA
jgi:hypothetical protein